jgi:hypothetical protein
MAATRQRVVKVIVAHDLGLFAMMTGSPAKEAVTAWKAAHVSAASLVFCLDAVE